MHFPGRFSLKYCAAFLTSVCVFQSCAPVFRACSIFVNQISVLSVFYVLVFRPVYIQVRGGAPSKAKCTSFFSNSSYYYDKALVMSLNSVNTTTTSFQRDLATFLLIRGRFTKTCFFVSKVFMNFLL